MNQAPEPTDNLDDTLKSQRSKSYDPAKPLDPPRYEKFVIQVFRGVQKYQAYQAAISPGASKIPAGQGASQLLKVPKVAQRLQYLMEKEAAAKVERPMDIQEMRAKMETIARFGTSSEAVSAIRQLREWDKEDDERDKGGLQRMDPAAICAWLAQFAGHPAEHLAQIPGGIKYMLQALMELTGTSAEQLIAELGGMTHELPAPETVNHEPETPAIQKTDRLDFENTDPDIQDDENK